MKRLLLTVAACVLAAACNRGESKEGPPPVPPTPPAAPAAPAAPVEGMAKLDQNAILERIKVLSSDEYEGRAPGTKGEELTVRYLVEESKKLGLKPGNPDGTYVQKVPLIGMQSAEAQPFTVSKGAQKETFKWGDDVVPWTKRVTPTASINNSDMVFVGYGVTAPEYQWDDFKNLDVKGKTIVVLINDPQVPAPGDATKLDDRLFNGKAMTYYGRWTYKFEEGARRGAAGILIVHETAPAGYPFPVVQGNLREKFDVVTKNKNMDRSAIEGWVTLDVAKKIFEMAGQNFDDLKKKALTKEFQPVPLGLKASLGVKNTIRTIDSQNVIAKVEGSDPTLKDEYVVYSSHWDHLGVGAEVNGDKIYNGALDNASGTATLFEIARGFLNVDSEAEALDPVPLGHRRRARPSRLALLRDQPAVSVGQDRRQHQHRRREPVGQDEGRDHRRHGRLGPRRRPPRSRRGAEAHLDAGSGIREGLLLPLRPLQLREGRRASAVYGYGRAIRRQGSSVQPEEARRIHEQRLPQAVGPD